MPTASQSIPLILDIASSPEASERAVRARLKTPPDLLVATILAAQCTDERVNRVTATLFQTYRTAGLRGRGRRLKRRIRPTGFLSEQGQPSRARAALVDRFGGEVPWTMRDLVTLPGGAEDGERRAQHRVRHPPRA